MTRLAGEKQRCVWCWIDNRINLGRGPGQIPMWTGSDLLVCPQCFQDLEVVEVSYFGPKKAAS